MWYYFQNNIQRSNDLDKSIVHEVVMFDASEFTVVNIEKNVLSIVMFFNIQFCRRFYRIYRMDQENTTASVYVYNIIGLVGYYYYCYVY